MKKSQAEWQWIFSLLRKQSSVGGNMIDIHSHILPGIDDGALDFCDLLDMADIAVESGIKGIIATPHCNIPGVYDNYFNEEYRVLFENAEYVLKKEGLPVTLYPGMEVFMTPEVPKLLKEGKLLTLNGSKNMLVEFDFAEDPSYADRMLSELIEMGIRPVIAHPERYEFVHDDLGIVYKWFRQGCLIQVNKASFLGRFGKRAEYAAYRLLNHNLVNVVASDAHNQIKRTPFMLDAYDVLLRNYPQRYIDTLFYENTRRICKGLPVLQFEPRPFE